MVFRSGERAKRTNALRPFADLTRGRRRRRLAAVLATAAATPCLLALGMGTAVFADGDAPKSTQSLSLSGEQIVRLMEALPAILMAAGSLIVSLRARHSAKQAQNAARNAHERAAEAAREQINFALRRQVTAEQEEKGDEK